MMLASEFKRQHMLKMGYVNKKRGVLMVKIARLFILLLLVLLAGCAGIAKYDDDEVAAIVKGEEITVGDLRFLYPDDTALDYLDWAIKVELIKQELKKIGTEIEMENDWFQELPPKNTNDQDGKQIRKYAESQAKKLNMTPEEFQKEYTKRINRQNAYIFTYIEEMTGEIHPDNEEEIEQFWLKADELLDELVKENEVEIKVLIK